MIGALLGHKRIATTQRYAHLLDQPLRDLTEKASQALGVLKSPPPAGNILQHKRRARR
jgi:hypothetical protein